VKRLSLLARATGLCGGGLLRLRTSGKCWWRSSPVGFDDPYYHLRRIYLTLQIFQRFLFDSTSIS
jgi:hypothetical protein